MIRALAFTLVFWASSVAAQQLQLRMPVDCALGETCFIQNYVDRDPGPEYREIGCGQLSYDGHRGTDIALYDHIAMDQGVNVRAAADGIVAATRDGMPDILVTDPNAPDVTGRACGNAVIIDHPDGWQTRYCHMKRGSLRVKTGVVVRVMSFWLPLMALARPWKPDWVSEAPLFTSKAATRVAWPNPLERQAKVARIPDLRPACRFMRGDSNNLSEAHR